MEDRFKFRAWHTPTKKMFEVYGFNSDLVFEDTLDGVETTPYNPAQFKDCILMQCTGLKDMNGKLIYEGDILEFLDYKPIVKWDEKYGRLHFITTNRAELRTSSANEYEIIGNIYENPELLEAKNANK